MPCGIGTEDEISLQEPATKYRFDCRDVVFEDVSLGQMVATKRSRKAAPQLGSCRLLTGGHGHHHRKVLGTDGCAAPTLCAGNDIGHGSRICKLQLVPPTESEWCSVYYTNQEGHSV